MKKEAIDRLRDASLMGRRRLVNMFLSGDRRKAREVGLGVLLLIVVLLAAISRWLDRQAAVSPTREQVAEQTPGPPAGGMEVLSRAPREESILPPAPPPYLRTAEITPENGDALFDLLLEEGIPSSRIHELVVAARPVHDLGRLRAGIPFTVEWDKRDGKVLRFELDLDGEQLMVVERGGDGLCARKTCFDFQIQQRVTSATIHDSLFLAADDAGLPPSLTLSLAEIFAWDIDFHVDMRDGDFFRVLYEEKYLDGKLAHHGRMLAAFISNQGRPFWAFYFEGSDGRPDYYDQEGHSLRKVFLKSPLKFTRISSRYSRSRLHPILKIYRPHLGVDYAAPVGTPVKAIGDGRVVYAGWNGGYGRFIRIRHNGTYTSTYGHLHHFARGIKRGNTVDQGQVIGYVGATGLATGPHLDFRLLKNGSFINPLTVNYPNADPVKEEDRPDFHERVRHLMAEMEGQGPALAQTSERP